MLYNVSVGGKPHEVMQWGSGSPGDAAVANATVANFAARAKAEKASIRWGAIHGRVG